MNLEFLNKINNELIKDIKAKHNFDDAKVLTISEAGKSSIISSLKQFVLKNGTKDIEDILLDKTHFEGSKMQSFCYQNFHKDIAEKNILNKQQTDEVASFLINQLISQFKTGFNASGNTKDLNGICQFLSIDKALLGLVNSPVTKFFGNFLWSRILLWLILCWIR